MLNQIPISFSPLLSLSGYLVIFPKMSNCAGWWTHGFTFALVLLYHDSNRLLPHSIPSHFSDRGFPSRWALDCTTDVMWFANNTLTSAIYKFTTKLSHHTLFCVTQFALKISETYNLTVRFSCLLGNPCHPILKLVRPLSTLDHFLESLSRIGGLVGSQNFQFLVVVSYARHLQSSFQVYAISIQFL